MSRRDALKLGAAFPLALALPSLGPFTEGANAEEHAFLKVRDKVPDPENVFFEVTFPNKAPIRLAGHFWYNAETAKAGIKCPAIVEFNPYRRRDGTMIGDAKMYPWFAYNDYLCFRVDLPGSGDSEGVLTDEYSEEELLACVQVINQVAGHPACDGNVGMMGKSWSAINSLMVAARKDRPPALKAVIVCDGSDDRYNDDVHYMGGAMMFDNISWPSSMWGWLAQPPDPAVVGEAWKEMWKERIDNADFWFKQWAGHQARDDYWSATAVRGHYGDVGVPVFITSGWQDGYKNPVEHVVTGLTALGKPVAGLIGAWGHKYPFNGYPGPRVDWLNYILVSWWDRWLKGRTPPPEGQWPQLPVWLGASKEPDKSTCDDEVGKWVAEDGFWQQRVRETVLYLRPNKRMGKKPSSHVTLLSSGKPVLDSEMLETSSWGECGNDDLPGNQASFDRASLYFDSDPLREDLDVFGAPVVTLTLSADRPIAALALRLNEVSPRTGASHLVCYRFCNLADRSGDLASPERVVPGEPFTFRVTLNLMGHSFKKGWRIRLALSPSFYPTLWESPEAATVTLHTGESEGGAASAITLPGRGVREEDKKAEALLPKKSAGVYVNPDDYLPILAEARPAETTRKASPETINGKPGILTRKVFDGGKYQYGGPLQGLWVDQVAEENFEMVIGEPLSLKGFTSSTAIFERPDQGFRARSETTTDVWSEENDTGGYVFRYRATIKAFIGQGPTEDQPFRTKTVEGVIARSWI
ncbi:MAG TPA: CocE/NonD family hydrolase [Methyloceanibacter sp.]|nr:CocE/NonD family hydrolase [Methyloceanibacter sp.]